MGLAAVHNVDKEGRASIAHTDISPAQFVRVGDKYKLNDFNRARFLRWNISSESLCTFSIASNPGKNRSPEEYNFLPETEKVSRTFLLVTLTPCFVYLTIAADGRLMFTLLEMCSTCF
jgi:hypothetical protein